MLTDKINSAIRILKLAEKQAQQYNEPVEIAYSGGKDSDVILELAKMSSINFVAVYKNTTIDPPGTIQHVRENGVQIRQPRESFFQLVKKHGFPSFRFRYCCQYLKEYKILNTAVWGVRAEESPARKKRYKEANFCKVYSTHQKVNVFVPIFDWTLDDVKNFTLSRKIKLAPNYYNNGVIDFNRRLGCLGCPLQYNRGIEDFKKNPAFLKAFLRAGAAWCETHPRELFADVFELFIYRTFYKTTENYLQDLKRSNLFERESAKTYLERYFNTTFNF